MAKYDKESNLNSGLIYEGDGQDPGTAEVLAKALAPRETNLVGNLADLQRGAGAVAAGQADSVAVGVELPPGTTAEGVAKEQAAAEKVQAILADATDAVADVNSGDDAKPASKSKK